MGFLLVLGSHASYTRCFPGGSMLKNLPAMQEAQERPICSLGWEDSLEESMATHSSILAWRNPGTEEPDELKSMGPQRVGRNWRDNMLTSYTDHKNCIPFSWVFCGDLDGCEGGGKEVQEGGDICVHTADSLCCTAEINTTLQINYTPVKNLLLIYSTGNSEQNSLIT